VVVIVYAGITWFQPRSVDCEKHRKTLKIHFQGNILGSLSGVSERSVHLDMAPRDLLMGCRSFLTPYWSHLEGSKCNGTSAVVRNVANL